MGEESAQGQSFADILAGVKRMREQYEPASQKSNTDDTTKLATSATQMVETTTDNNATSAKQPPQASAPTPNQPAPSTKLRTRKLPSQYEPGSRPNVEESAPKPTPSVVPSKRARTDISGPSEILVYTKQKGNPMFKDLMMKSTPWTYDGEILCDYFISRTFQILFLSLKYHRLRPEYIWSRVKKLNGGTTLTVQNAPRVNTLRVLLCVVDIDSPDDELRKLLDFCVKQDLSLVLAWLYEEAGNYVAMSKQLANTPSRVQNNIAPPKDRTYMEAATDLLTTVTSVNKTDVKTLLANCRSFRAVVEASCNPETHMEDVQGIGPAKAERLRRFFSEPFIVNKNYKNADEV